MSTRVWGASYRGVCVADFNPEGKACALQHEPGPLLPEAVALGPKGVAALPVHEPGPAHLCRLASHPAFLSLLSCRELRGLLSCPCTHSSFCVRLGELACSARRGHCLWPALTTWYGGLSPSLPPCWADSSLRTAVSFLAPSTWYSAQH